MFVVDLADIGRVVVLVSAEQLQSERQSDPRSDQIPVEDGCGQRRKRRERRREEMPSEA